MSQHGSALNARSDMLVDNWASVDTALVFKMARVTACCSLAHLVRSEKQECAATCCYYRVRQKEHPDLGGS